ncbi:transposase [Pectobacterium versatile]|uniref:transposase n=1 Tax=Pectobacterium versatile TaxID=2488639 RepID=UPI001FFD974F|nr:transposase [Pectobacterium versatile]
MTKSVSTCKKPRKQHTPEFRKEALKLAERIVIAARELSLYESQLYNWRGKQQSVRVDRLQRLPDSNASWLNEELAILQKAATYFAKRLK